MTRLLIAVLMLVTAVASAAAGSSVQARGNDGGKAALPTIAEEDEEESNLDRYFTCCDKNKDGKITADEVKQALKALGTELRAAGSDEDKKKAVRGKYAIPDAGEFAGADVNDDSSVTKKELEDDELRFFEPIKNWSERNIADFLELAWLSVCAGFDSDDDGVVTNKEAGDEWLFVGTLFDADSNGQMDKKECVAGRDRLIRNVTIIRGEKEFADKDAVVLVFLRKVGNTSLTKRTMSSAWGKSVSYERQEVVEVVANFSKIRCTPLDEKKKESASKTIPKRTKTLRPKADAPQPKETIETIKVEAGEFECTKIETDANNEKVTTWWSKKTPGLIVREDRKGSGGGITLQATSELVEFKEK